MEIASPKSSALAVNEISWACLSQIQGMTIVLNLGFAEHLEASALRSKNPITKTTCSLPRLKTPR